MGKTSSKFLGEDLGLTISADFSWQPHYHSISSNAFKILGYVQFYPPLYLIVANRPGIPWIVPETVSASRELRVLSRVFGFLWSPIFSIEKAWSSLDKLVFRPPPRLPRIGRCGAGRTRV